MDPDFYQALEDRFRGSRELVQSRLSVYVPILEVLREHGIPPRGVDVGGGRAEWAETAQAAGFTTVAIDTDPNAVAAHRSRGFEIVHADALDAMRAMPTESTGVVTAFHLIEHLEFGRFRELVREAMRVLVPGGVLILETPNPESLVVAGNHFYLDPDHVRPLPLELTQFAAEHTGFFPVRSMRLHGIDDPNGDRKTLVRTLVGIGQDYAVVAVKPGGPDAVAVRVADYVDGCDSASFPEFVAEFDQSLVEEFARIEQRITEALEKLSTSNELRRLVHDELELAERRVTERFGAALDESLAELESRLTTIFLRERADIEWRSDVRLAVIDSALSTLQEDLLRRYRRFRRIRWALRVPGRMRSAAREGRLRAAVRTRVKTKVLRPAYATLKEHPAMHHAASFALRAFPAADRRLRRTAANMRRSTEPVPGSPDATLSERARDIHVELLRAVRQVHSA